MTDRRKLDEAIKRVEKWHRAWIYEVDEATPIDDDALALIKEALADYERIKAECDEWEKAAKLWKDGNYRLQAELARYQPLIEAAERARKSTLTTDRIFWGTDILRAALAYKEKP